MNEGARELHADIQPCKYTITSVRSVEVNIRISFYPSNSLEHSYIFNNCPVPGLGHPGAEVFSPNGGLWREIHPPNNRILSRRESHARYHLCDQNFEYAQVDGVLYWIADRERILSIDLGSEKFGFADLPRIGGCELGPRRLTVFKNNLCFIVSLQYQCFDVWVRNARGNGEADGAWTRLACMGPFFGVRRPLGFGINGEIFMEGSNYWMLNACEPKTSRLWGEYGLGYAHGKPFEFHFYTEGLAPLAPKGQQTFL